MSMDWTPAILHTVEKNLVREGYEPLREREIFLVLSDKSKVSITNKAAREEYPELSFLFDNFNALYEKYKGNDRASMVFAEVETALKEAEQESDMAGAISRKSNCKKYYELEESELTKCDIRDVTQEWFYGQLDKCFYYNTENNMVFLNYIEAKITEIEEK